MTDLCPHGQTILHLYELRREPELRRARAWFATDFAPAGPADILALLQSGAAASAAYRMVTTYWEMAAALVNRGALDRDLFLAANSEHLAVFAMVHPCLDGLRALIREPGYLRELETLVLGIPDVLPLLEARRRLFDRWRKEAAAASA